MKTVKKGSITIFLALILSLILSLVSASIESVRMSAARTQILNSMDIGLYSLFGQYDRTLLEDYDLFALYAGGKEEPDMASVYENFQSYMKPVLKQNSQKQHDTSNHMSYQNGCQPSAKSKSCKICPCKNLSNGDSCSKPD